MCVRLGGPVAFTNEVKKIVQDYAFGHIGTFQWHKDFFDFIKDVTLAERLAEEFMAARFVYKILEGLEAKEWQMRTQIRTQVLSYASIYEAVLHHVLFDLLPADPKVVSLTRFPTNKKTSIPAEHQKMLQRYLSHDGKKIIPTYETIGKTDKNKVRFGSKAKCAFALGFINEKLKDELIEIYEARNTIHIHAEIKKSLKYQLDLSRRAYLRMEPFRNQIKKRLKTMALI
jgi:hypothetical protein